ncbi:sexual development activator VeA [Teratosphaeria destructans]|uniref:Sexual development activator VeA n=1 Tax=Teratosphaeria destructans TaxID=418781 RepID=A0A9W7T1V9_9PEZI|nr:sexual development activator VeA [Teratosphaeria destructans]
MFSATGTPADSHKRSYGQVFPGSERHTHRPLRQGARPADAWAANYDQFESDPLGDDGEGETEGGDLNPIRDEMRYKRADGRCIHRMLPSSDGPA